METEAIQSDDWKANSQVPTSMKEQEAPGVEAEDSKMGETMLKKKRELRPQRQIGMSRK